MGVGHEIDRVRVGVVPALSPRRPSYAGQQSSVNRRPS
jgi:hypothetical protein